MLAAHGMADTALDGVIQLVQDAGDAKSVAYTAATTARRNSEATLQDMDLLLAALAVKSSSRQAASSGADAARFSQSLVPPLQPIFDAYEKWERENILIFLQEQIEIRLGDTCPYVHVAIAHNSVELKRPLNFEGGCATIVETDMVVMEQVAIYTHYTLYSRQTILSIYSLYAPYTHFRLYSPCSLYSLWW
jgi:hypothetical protein